MSHQSLEDAAVICDQLYKKIALAVAFLNFFLQCKNCCSIYFPCLIASDRVPVFYRFLDCHVLSPFSL